MLDVHALIFQILTYLIQLGVLLLIGSVCNFIVKKVGQTKFAAYANQSKLAVQAAEQILGPSLGADKKTMVVNWLTNAFGKGLSSDEIEKLIESAVYEMNLVIKSNLQLTAGDVPAVSPETAPIALYRAESMPIVSAPAESVPVEPIPVESVQPDPVAIVPETPAPTIDVVQQSV